MEPTEMELRVAKALCNLDGYVWEHQAIDHPSLRGQDWYLDCARAAIRAMREPTKEMLDAGEIVELTRPGLRGPSMQIADSQRERRWKQMIDCASPERKEGQ